MKKYNFYKEEIQGLSDVKETVQVIEKSSASHIHFLKQRVEALSIYQERVQQTLKRLSLSYWDFAHPLLKERVSGRKALLVLTGDKGIVGGLYHDLVNKTLSVKDEYEDIWVLGSKGREYLLEEGVNAEEISLRTDSDTLPSKDGIAEVSGKLFKRFKEETFCNIDVLYPKFFSLADQRPQVTKFLPFALKAEDITSGAPEGFPIFDPDKKTVFDELIKKYIHVSLSEIILEAKLSELAARTVTAENAVKETEHLIRTLHMEFLKARHVAISQKQVESFNVHTIAS